MDDQFARETDQERGQCEILDNKGERTKWEKERRPALCSPSSKSPNLFLVNFQTKNATTPMTATPPATLSPMIEPVLIPEESSLDLVCVAAALDDDADAESDAGTVTVVSTGDPCALVV